MDGREAQGLRAAERQRTISMVRSKHWPLWPYLPLAKPPREPGQPRELGVLWDGEGSAGVEGYQTTVWLINVCDVGDTIRSIAQLLKQPHIRYASLSELIDVGGWRVD